MSHQYSPAFERAGRLVAKHAKLVILAWIAVGVLVNTAWPQLERVANEHSVSPLPTGEVSPALASMKEMGKAFGRPGIDNAVIIVMHSDKGFDADAQARYSALIDRLGGNKEYVTFVQDQLGDPRMRNNPVARKQVLSEDGTTWYAMAGLAGDLGTPLAQRSYRSVDDLVKQTFAGSATTANITGAAGTITDMGNAALGDLPKIGAVTVVVIGLILLLVFRSWFTAMLPLLVMGMSLLIARGVIAGLADRSLVPVSSVSAGLMMAVLMGASVNYTVFLVSRYHERIRAGEEPPEALAHACGSMTRVILATAATVAIANIAQLTAKLAFLAAAGPAVSMGVIVAFFVVTTLLPATLSLAATRGLGLPGPDRAGVYWHRMGANVVRHPWPVFGVAIVILLAAASFVPFMRPSFDMSRVLPDSAQSNQGMHILNAHFPANSVMPQYLLIQAPSDLRNPRALGDLDQMAERISQLKGVGKVVGITRPDGNKLTQATLAWQIGYMGTQIDKTSGQVNADLRPQLERMSQLADVMSAMTNELGDGDLARMQQMMPQMLSMAKEVEGQLDRYQSLISQMGTVAGMVDQLATMGPSVEATFSALDAGVSLTQTLTESPFCPVQPDCVKLRDQLVALRDTGPLSSVESLRESVRTVTGGKTITQLLGDMNSQFKQIRGLLVKLPEMERKFERISGYFQQLKGLGVDMNSVKTMGVRIRDLNTQLEDAARSMGEAAVTLQTIGKDSNSPAASGFSVPGAMLQNPGFKELSSAFLQDDGRTAMYLVQSPLNPYGPEAMQLSRDMERVGNEATPNTALAGATVSVGGFPAINADLKKAYDSDLREIIVVTLLIIFVVMCLLLRAVVAPLYLLGTVLLTYIASLGIGVLVFQVLLGQQLDWAVPAMTFVLIVAVGADYNMLFISRLREESARGMRLGIIRTVRQTGSVITSAGLVFAASLLGMMVGSVNQMVQMGFIIGVGILLDTFIVRTLMVPTLAQAFGKLSWWPSKA
ncbi:MULTISPECIES: RND family transporter [unclassified Mycobacterium]|uniref:MMPL/RND family transporter n=1 Tax=unclassified Mycobacterium TaxID=2642494 RepID=UPI000992E09E|nr:MULTISPECIES: RND family transporter [unclassified Mycobacterium]